MSHVDSGIEASHERCGMRAADLPGGECVSIGDGTAVVLRVNGEIRAFLNRCPHQGASLVGGWIDAHRGVGSPVLSCPHHFWRFDAMTGAHTADGPGLTPLAVEIIDGQVVVDTPPTEPARPIREVLLEHAEQWNRDQAASPRATPDPASEPDTRE